MIRVWISQLASSILHLPDLIITSTCCFPICRSFFCSSSEACSPALYQLQMEAGCKPFWNTEFTISFFDLRLCFLARLVSYSMCFFQNFVRIKGVVGIELFIEVNQYLCADFFQLAFGDSLAHPGDAEEIGLLFSCHFSKLLSFYLTSPSFAACCS